MVKRVQIGDTLYISPEQSNKKLHQKIFSQKKFFFLIKCKTVTYNQIVLFNLYMYRLEPMNTYSTFLIYNTLYI